MEREGQLLELNLPIKTLIFVDTPKLSTIIFLFYNIFLLDPFLCHAWHARHVVLERLDKIKYIIKNN